MSDSGALAHGLLARLLNFDHMDFDIQNRSIYVFFVQDKSVGQLAYSETCRSRKKKNKSVFHLTGYPTQCRLEDFPMDPGVPFEIPRPPMTSM